MNFLRKYKRARCWKLAVETFEIVKTKVVEVASKYKWYKDAINYQLMCWLKVNCMFNLTWNDWPACIYIFILVFINCQKHSGICFRAATHDYFHYLLICPSFSHLVVCFIKCQMENVAHCFPKPEVTFLNVERTRNQKCSHWKIK